MTASLARSQLQALCERGLDWALPPYRIPPATMTLRPAAVLMLFGVLDREPARADGPVARDLDVLLLRRASTLGAHAGQVAFPGGRIDASDRSPVEGALREAVEETGLDPSGVETLGTLPPFPLAVSRHVVTPVAGWWTRPSEVMAVDHAETVDVFRLPVADLLDPANRRTSVARRADGTWRSPAFRVGEVVVWGFTGIVLSRVFDELGWAVPWDESREVEV